MGNPWVPDFGPMRALMTTNQRYIQDPPLALAYYNLFGTYPDSFVLGDEQIRGDDGNLTRERIGKLLDDYTKAADIALCQREVLEYESSSTTIGACVSCGAILLQNNSYRVFFSTLEHLHTIRLSPPLQPTDSFLCGCRQAS